jgi:excisionase family DNA binding protein
MESTRSAERLLRQTGSGTGGAKIAREFFVGVHVRSCSTSTDKASTDKTSTNCYLLLMPTPAEATDPTVDWKGSDDELLTAQQAATLLTVHRITLLNWAHERRIPCIRLGPRTVRWTRPMLRRIRDEAASDYAPTQQDLA